MRYNAKFIQRFFILVRLFVIIHRLKTLTEGKLSE